MQELIRYRLDTSHGPIQHGQGKVWKADDVLFGDSVALKELKDDLVDSPQAVESFRKEAAVGARLSRICSNIVPVRDFGRAGGSLYFAMDWIAGRACSAICGQVTVREAVGIVRQVCTALSVAHGHGIVHSDVAPANILQREATHQVYLSDFGYLKILDTTLVSQGQASLMIGFRQYYVPREHLYHPDLINASTDVYATALTLHTIITGATLPFGATGRPEIPAVIKAPHEGRSAPDGLRKLLTRFVAERSESDTISDLVSYLDRL